MIERISAAYKTVRADLLAACGPAGHWVGELSSSALATATAISALATYEQRMKHEGEIDEATDERIRQLIVAGLGALSGQQNADGGWGDTDRSESNIATTMLVRAAFQLTGVPSKPVDLVEKADAYIRQQGGVKGLRRRYGKDKTFAVPILTNYALAGLMPWRQVPALPFELACLPQSTYRFLRLPVVSYAVPALVAVGLARFANAPPLNPMFRWLRRRVIEKGLRVVENMQPVSGGFLEAVPLTSFVAMSLASAGHVDHPIVHQSIQFIMESARSDGSWPIDSNLSMWVTGLSVNALAAGEEHLADLQCRDWILAQQFLHDHPYTGATAGGWSWTDLSGGVPDADDTAGALLALSEFARQYVDREGAAIPLEIYTAAEAGIDWLLRLQNNDGGWPTFCRGWGALPFDRSGTDLTAHALRALRDWYVNFDHIEDYSALDRELRAANIVDAIERGFGYLRGHQQGDGSWLPLWFGNQFHKDETNPIYGTAKVLMCYRDLGKLECDEARRAFDWLLAAQDIGGGWGGSGRDIRKGTPHQPSSVEETSLALEALLAEPRLATDPSLQHMVNKGLAWLTDAIERNGHTNASPIGFYFAKLWYYEKLYPLVFATSALAHAIRVLQTDVGVGPHQTTNSDISVDAIHS